MAIDSIPPDAEEDPRRADRYGEGEGCVVSGDAECRQHEKTSGCDIAGQSIIGSLRHGAPRCRERLFLPGIELAVAGRLTGIGWEQTGVGGAPRAAA